MNTWIFVISTVLCLMAGVIYGIFAGRHDAFPAPTIIRLKFAVEQTIGLKRQWRRTYFEDTRRSKPQPCPTANPIVILTGGQSNAANALSDPVNEVPNLAAFMFFQGKCYRLRDPILGATGDKGSLWTALGQRLVAETGRNIIFMNGAITASTYRDWLNPNSGYFARLRELAQDAARHRLRPNFVLWHQGESDARRDAASEVFESELQALVDRLKSDLPLASGAKLVLYRASLCSGTRRRTPNQRLVTAQRRVAERTANVIVGPDTDRYGKRFRYDDCHFNGRGREAIVEATARLLIPLIAQPP